MRALLVLVVLLVALAVLVFALLERRRRRTARWALRERSDGEAVVLYAERPDEPAMLLERVPLASEDFELRVEEARAGARGKLVALNSGRP